MHAIETFLLTNIVEKGRVKDSFLAKMFTCGLDLEGLANVCLTPLRVLWHGRTVVVVRKPITFKRELKEVHHVRSFHPQGKDHVSRTKKSLHSEESNWVLQALCIVVLIPAFLIGGALKMVAHLFEETRENYRFTCEHFLSEDIHIGSASDLVSEMYEDAAFKAEEIAHRRFNKKVKHLIVHGKNLFLTARGKWISEINPRKIILDEGTSLFRGEPPPWWHLLEAGQDAIERGVDAGRELIKGEFLPALIDSGKFEIVRGIPRVYTVASIAEAKAHKPPKRPNGKPYHALYLVRKR